MDTNVNIAQIEEQFVDMQGHQVLLDQDGEAPYHAGTKEVSQAVKNNPDKYPKGYVICALTRRSSAPGEWRDLRSKGLTTNFLKTRVPTKAEIIASLVTQRRSSPCS